MKHFRIAEEFSKHPAGRYRTDGKFSGERFREDYLVRLINSKDQTVIDFDGARGYGSSFLEEAFGGLARKINKEIVLSKFVFKSRDHNLVERIRSYIEHAREAKIDRRTAG